jgi:DNA-binding LacI/PurR family transcriptional regulator
VHVHKQLLGRLAAEQLHRSLENPDDPPLKFVTPTALIVRALALGDGPINSQAAHSPV